MSNYNLKPVLKGYSDSANSGGRIGSSAFALPIIDLDSITGGTGIAKDDTLGGAAAAKVSATTPGLGISANNSVVRRIGIQVIRPLVNAAGTTITAVPLLIKIGTNDAVTVTLDSGATGASAFADVTAAKGLTGPTEDVPITAVVGTLAPASNIVSGSLLLVFYVDYLPEVDEAESMARSVLASYLDGGSASFGGYEGTEYVPPIDTIKHVG